MKDKQTLTKELEAINKDIKKVNNNLIDALNAVGIEYINLYQYINLINNLKLKKQQIKTKLVYID